MSNLVFTPAYQLAQMIREQTVSTQEVLSAYLAQIKQHNPQVNAIATLDEEQAYKRAIEMELLAIAEAINQVAGDFQHPPGY